MARLSFEVGILALSLACRGGAAPEIPLVRITSHDFGYDMPARLPAGIVHLRLINHGPDIHEAMVVHFNDAGSAAGYVDSVRRDVDFPALAEDMGGAGLAAAGDSTDIYLDLEPGRYALVCWKGDHLSRGMARDFVVEEENSGSAVPPAADLTIVMTEYGYQISGPVTAGPHLIKVENRGTQPHEADIVRLESGKTMEDYLDWLDSGEPGKPPVAPVGGVGDFIGGRTVWMAVNLPPGRYFLVCQVPDASRDKPHYDLGMLHEFEVR